MVLKIFKAVWFLSFISVLGVFMFVYASLPETLILQDGANTLSISREAFFYLVLALLAVINTLVFVFMKLYPKNAEEFLTWFFGQIITVNLFIIIAVSFVNLYNSQEKFDYLRLGPVIYGSVGLIVVWAAAWPIYTIYKRFSRKAAV